MGHKTTKDKIFVADPAQGLLEYSHQDFLEAWTTAQDKTGFVLLLEPNPNFFALKEDKNKTKNFGFLKIENLYFNRTQIARFFW